VSSNHPYHHGNLRQALLNRAAVVLRERGASALSLRELARDLNVSHGAPGRHFTDRQALLDALAAEGFTRLGDRLREAVAADSRFSQRVRHIADSYVDFAITEANMLELLYAHKHKACADAPGQSAADAYAPVLETFRAGQPEGVFPEDDPARTGLIFLATLQGIAAMVNSGMVPREQLEGLIDDAVAQFLRAARHTPAG
jgi:AcrR family transcriptional regulator